MTTALIVPKPSLDTTTTHVPALFRQAGERATRRVLEFFLAEIRNPNTRAAYARALLRFDGWCQQTHCRLEDLEPLHLARYVEQLGRELAKPSVKQHLAALRMLFDYLVVGQIISTNPAASVRGPKYVVKKGKTPVLSREEARALLDSIDDSSLKGCRDRALIAIMIYSFARVGAVVSMNVEDYYQQGIRHWIRLHEKGGKAHEVPAHHKIEEYVHAYLLTAGIAGQKGTPLFRSIDRHRTVTGRRLDRREVFAMVRHRAQAANLGDRIGCHSFRATGITAFLHNGGKPREGPRHNAPQATKLHQPQRRNCLKSALPH